MKQGWKTDTIDSLCEQMNGIWKGTKEPFVTAKILRTTNFSKDCQMKLDDLAIIEVEQKKMDKRRLKRGDIIVEKSGGGPKQPVGRVILFDIDDDDFSFCNFTSALRIKDQSIILPEFLHKYLTYLYFNGETEKYQSNLVGFRNLDFKGYVSICVKYPSSLSEQQRIVALLDAEFAKIDALKANAEKNLQNAKDLFQAALKKELEPKEGWKKGHLSKVAYISRGRSQHRPRNEASLYGGDYPFIQTGDIRDANGGVISTYNQTYSEVGLQQSKLWKKGTICITIAANIGETAILGIDACFPDSVVGIIPDNQIVCTDFVNYCLIKEKDELNEIAHGTAQKNINVAILEKVLIAYPVEITIQQSIVSSLDTLNEKCKALQANYEKTLSLCDDLKQALLRKAFNGEI